MRSEIQEIEYCKFSVNYEADFNKVSAKRLEVLSKFKDLKVPGFRPGKATNEAILFNYKPQVENALKQALAEEAVNDVTFEKSLKQLGAAQFQRVDLMNNKFTCDFILHTKPDFELKQYKSFEMPKPAPPISIDEYVEKTLQELRVSYGDTNPYSETDFVEKGDSVIIDYDVIVDDVNINDLSKTGEMVHVGSTPIDGFDDNIIGMKLDEIREFALSVSPESVSKELSGKTLKFKVKLNMGKKVVPMPLDDNLAIKLGMDSLEKLRAEVYGTATQRIKQHEDQAVAKQVTKKLVTEHDFKVPAWLALAEAKIIAKNSKLEWDDVSDEQKEKFLADAADSVRLSLVLEKVRDSEPDAQMSDEEAYSAVVQSLHNIYAGQNISDIVKNLNASGYMSPLLMRTKDDYALQYIVKTCTLVE